MPSALDRPRVRRLVALTTLLLAALVVAAGAPGSHLASHAVPTTPAPARSQGDGDAQRPMGHEADGGEPDGGPRQAEQWFVQQRARPLAAIPSGARGHALAQVAALRRSLRAAPSSAPAFGASIPL